MSFCLSPLLSSACCRHQLDWVHFATMTGRYAFLTSKLFDAVLRCCRSNGTALKVYREYVHKVGGFSQSQSTTDKYCNLFMYSQAGYRHSPGRHLWPVTERTRYDAVCCRKAPHDRAKLGKPPFCSYICFFFCLACKHL